MLALHALPAVVAFLTFSGALDAPQAASEAPPPWPGWLRQTGPRPEAERPAAIEPAEGAIYYVSPQGSNAWSGTAGRPWQTIGRAVEAAGPGDTVMVGNGVYVEHVAVMRSGRPGQPITFRNWPSHAPVIDGTGLPRSWGLIEMHGQSHIRLAGLEVRNNARGCGIVARECSDLVIEDCRTAHTGQSGIMVWQCEQVVVDHNEVQEACRRGGEESISVKFGSADVQVSWNHIHHTGHEGVDVKEGSHNVRVFNNYLHHVERQGLYADAWNRDTHHIEFSSNVVHDSGFGIAVCSETGGRLHHVVVRNNLVYNNAGPGIILSRWTREPVCPVDNVAFVSNTVYNCGHAWGGGLAFENYDARDIIARNNILSANSTQVQAKGLPASGSLDRNLIFGPTEAEGTNALKGDPLFVDPEAGDFRLGPGSPAIGAGVATEWVTEDMLGNPRPAEAADMGAVQSGS